MITTSVPVTDSTHQALQSLSQETGRSIPEILDKAVEEYRRKFFFEGVDQDFAALKADPRAWAEELEDRRLSSNTLMDGLDPDDLWAKN